MGFGMMNGSFLGAKFARKIPRSWTLLLLAIIMLIAGGKMLFHKKKVILTIKRKKSKFINNFSTRRNLNII